ncbi:hypothetical protein BDV98DRAFT_584745 [Pterulicium gracile]|uniref:Uncharacterized protein n=1 Tax=Pterulicium gracile TaxID=1884261 RepID=A0A5C3QA28_9AGAR|nr:hypothetical protein BDV98DRAFT_584745 [Pterula gracilis]
MAIVSEKGWYGFGLLLQLATTEFFNEPPRRLILAAPPWSNDGPEIENPVVGCSELKAVVPPLTEDSNVMNGHEMNSDQDLDDNAHRAPPSAPYRLRPRTAFVAVVPGVQPRTGRKWWPETNMWKQNGKRRHSRSTQTVVQGDWILEGNARVVASSEWGEQASDINGEFDIMMDKRKTPLK